MLSKIVESPPRCYNGSPSLVAALFRMLVSGDTGSNEVVFTVY